MRINAYSVTITMSPNLHIKKTYTKYICFIVPNTEDTEQMVHNRVNKLASYSFTGTDPVK